jgi:hypothetical protein
MTAQPEPAPENPIRRTSLAGAMMVVTFGLRTLVNLVVISLASRFLVQDEFSLWLVLQSAAMYLALSEMGIAQSISNFTNVALVRNDRPEISRILSTAFGLYWLVVLPVMLVAVVGSWLLPPGRWLVTGMPGALAGTFQVACMLMAVLTLARVPLTVFPASLLGLRELVLWQLYELAVPITLLVATGSALALGGGIVALAVVTNASLAVLALLVYPVLIRPRAPFARLSLAHWDPGLVRKLFVNSSFFLSSALACSWTGQPGTCWSRSLEPWRRSPACSPC